VHPHVKDVPKEPRHRVGARRFALSALLALLQIVWEQLFAQIAQQAVHRVCLDKTDAFLAKQESSQNPLELNCATFATAKGLDSFRLRTLQSAISVKRNIIEPLRAEIAFHAAALPRTP
jgi:hypothetical protein